MNEKRILVTGATGLIGKEVLKPLRERGFTVFATKLPHEIVQPMEGVEWLDCDLFQEHDISYACATARAGYLLNFAWCTRDDYLSSNMNFDFFTASLHLLKHFHKNGGQRFIGAGTCFEYAFRDTALTEDAPTAPQTIYAKCKDHLHEMSEIFAMLNDVECGWGRIFFVYGRGEHTKRLGGKLIHNFRAGEPVFIPKIDLIRDYIYTRDIAGAFAAFADSAVIGTVNICTGKAITLRDFAGAFAKELHAESLLRLDPEINIDNQPHLIAGVNRRLREEVGYEIRYDLQTAVREIIRAAEENK